MPVVFPSANNPVTIGGVLQAFQRGCIPVCLLIPALWVGCKPAAGPSGAPQGRPPTPVVVENATVQPVTETLALVGSLMADEFVEIRSETDGTVKTIHFQEGERVEAGQLLLELDETKLAAALAEAEANFKLSRANHDRNKQLFEDELISQEEYDQFSATYESSAASLALKRRQLEDTRIHAPFPGILGARNVSPGQVIARNTTLTWLVDLDPVKVEVNVPERFLGQLKVGQTLDVQVAAYPDRFFRGQVYFVSPYVDPENRTALIKARIPNETGALLPGMFANLDLTLRVREQAIVIPEQAITQLLDNGAATLYTVDADNLAQLRKVQLGIRMPDKVEVARGLGPDETVIIEGTQKIGPGMPVVPKVAGVSTNDVNPAPEASP